MKRAISFSAVLVVAFLALAAPAFAGRLGGYWVVSSSTFGTFSRTSGAVTFTAAGGPSKITPHRGYTTTTGKCKVCHAVHGAGIVDGSGNIPTERLLRTAAADACTFCHLTNAYATNPYKGAPRPTNPSPNPVANYAGTGNGSGHYSNHQGTPYAGCASCHSVHGANVIAGSRILKDDPAKGVISDNPIGNGFGSRKDPVASMSEFCLDCHDGTQTVATVGGVPTVTPLNSNGEFAAEFPNCAFCHNSVTSSATDDTVQFGVAFNQNHDGRSHPMTSDVYGVSGKMVAGMPTYGGESATYTSCTGGCHNVDGDGDFPHFAAGDNALIVGYRFATQIDGVCLKCHGNFYDPDTGTTGGVGISF